MKTFAALLLGLAILTTAATPTFAADDHGKDKKHDDKDKKHDKKH